MQFNSVIGFGCYCALANKIPVKHEIASVTLPAAVFYYLCKRVAQFVLPMRPISYAI